MLHEKIFLISLYQSSAHAAANKDQVDLFCSFTQNVLLID